MVALMAIPDPWVLSMVVLQKPKRRVVSWETVFNRARLHAQIKSAQMASLPTRNHLVVCALVSHLPAFLQTSS